MGNLKKRTYKNTKRLVLRVLFATTNNRKLNQQELKHTMIEIEEEGYDKFNKECLINKLVEKIKNGEKKDVINLIGLDATKDTLGQDGISRIEKYLHSKPDNEKVQQNNETLDQKDNYLTVSEEKPEIPANTEGHLDNQNIPGDIIEGNIIDDTILDFHTINVPKIEGEGEDADPISFIYSTREWGVIGVFDGMGGAGAKKYKHKETGEEHTNAFWASRIVRDAVQTIFEERNCDEDLIAYIDATLHESIVKALNDAMSMFPNSNSSVMSKMTRKLPTTMSLSIFHLINGSIQIFTYWAGDSRIYALTKDSMFYLSRDDSETENGDPYSPMSTDSTMNNAISQDRPFKINKYFIELPISLDNPLLMIAATDGCFGYFKNPIEFEDMLRNSILNSQIKDDFMDKVKQAVIENMQQDDFSMAAFGLGCETFEKFREVMTSNPNGLSTDYLNWRNTKESEYEKCKNDVKTYEEKLMDARTKLDKFYADIETQNEEWYQKYKETISVIDPQQIKEI